MPESKDPENASATVPSRGILPMTYKILDLNHGKSKWRRSKKVALIEKANLRWEDLAEKWVSEMRFAGQALS